MRPKLVLAVLATASVWAQDDVSKAKYKDPNAAPEDRAADLISRMTLEEKVRQMQNTAPAIPRLDIPAYEWWNEALHGVARAGLATVFPQAIGLAATWDIDLERRIAGVISTEARAKHNDALRHDNHRRYFGLTFWSPNINIFRDPRWGRGQETYGEDPYLTSQMALAFIAGMQGDDPRYFKTIATSKHFAVHSGPEVSRHQFDAEVSEQDLDNTYLYAFRKTLSGEGAYSVMCAYNSLKGAPACASTFLLQDELREAWKFRGYVVSDCGAINDIFAGHHYTSSLAEAAAKAVKAGTDLTCGNEYVSLVEAVKKGYITEEEINRSLKRLFVARFRLGMFDPPERVPFSTIGMDQVASASHRRVALEAAEKSIVLLKNENHILPLVRAPARIAVVGPAADDPDTLLGNYYGTPRHLVTPLAGIQEEFGGKSKVEWAQGSVYAQSFTSLIPPAALTPPNANAGQNGVLAEYFNNENLEGKPALARVEPRGYFIYNMRDPTGMRALSSSTFAVRWTATLRPEATGDYQLGLARQECDSCLGSDTWRLFVNGNALIDETRSASGHVTLAERVRGLFRADLPFTVAAKIHLEAGKPYEIRAEYVQREGGGGAELVWTPPEGALLEAALKTVRQSDLAIVCVGLNSRLEGEESQVEIPGFSHGDRTDIALPEPQEKLLDAALATGKPVVVVLLNGSALAITAAKERAQAILEAWYGGQEGGLAIAKTLSGENNPAGRLPVTFYESVDQLPPFTEYSMQGRTYRYFTGKPLYQFGYGLSYSQFRYSGFSSKAKDNSTWEVSSRVANVSSREGDEVAQLYLLGGVSKLELRGFRRLHLRAGETETVTFEIDRSELKGKSARIGGGQPDAP